MRSNGETNPATIIVAVALIGAGYYGFFAVPLYLDNLDVREACDEAFNVYVLQGEEYARQKLLFRLNGIRGIGWHYETDEDGEEVKKPGLEVPEEAITVKFDEQTKELLVRVEYDRIVQFKPFAKRKTFHFSAQKAAVVSP